MDFIDSTRPKILRTRLYGDQEFERFELELLHTPIMQRLYNLKQLGFADRVYPDAVHSRFNHVLGATEVVSRMAKRLIVWLHAHGGEQFVYDKSGGSGEGETVTGDVLRENVESRLPALRLMALLHDVTHGAFGHTLEDEVSVFNEKHDDPTRQTRFFNALVAQLLYLWCTEQRLHSFDGALLQELSSLQMSTAFKQERRWAEELGESLSARDRKLLAQRLRQLEFAFRLLLRIEFAHTHQHTEPAAEELLVSHAAKMIDSTVPVLDFVFGRDLFMIDLVGNTICADLLDYARRDADNAGLKIQFDDRFLRYMCVVTATGELSPTQTRCIRTAIQIFTDKMRHDVLSEISGILKARYLINERVLFHPTKCAAGAMLGTAVQLLGLRDLPGWMQVLGDQELLRLLTTIAANLSAFCSRIDALSGPPKSDAAWDDVIDALWPADAETAKLLQTVVQLIVPEAKGTKALPAEGLESLRSRADAARNVLWRLSSRRFPKLAYRMRNAHHTGGASDETVAETYCRPKDRYTLERRIEELCNLPIGSIFVHCPRRKTSMKVAEALVVGSDLSRPAQLRSVTRTTVSSEGLEPYEREILAVEEMYRSIWQFHAYLDPAHWHKQPLVEWAFERELDFRNDRLLAAELSQEARGTFHVLASDLRDEIPPKWLPAVIRRVDAEVPSRMRLGRTDEDPHVRLRAIIREVLAEVGTAEGQLGLPGIDAGKG